MLHAWRVAVGPEPLREGLVLISLPLASLLVHGIKKHTQGAPHEGTHIFRWRYGS